MMPCKVCTPVDERGIPHSFEKAGKILKGLKQNGKTKYSRNEINFERVYICQDCGAKWKIKGSLASMKYKNVPLLEIV